jgi:hypothetical protein
MRHIRALFYVSCIITIGVSIFPGQASAENQPIDADKRKLNTSIQRLIALIGEGEHRLASSEVVAAARLLRRSARGETLSEPEKEWKRLIEDLLDKRMEVPQYRQAVLQIGFMGSLAIRSAPPGAVIVLDGKETGFITPHTLKATLGEHVVEVRSSPAHPVAAPRIVRVEANKTTGVDFTLAPIGYGTLIIGSRPFGAQIYLDGKQQGNTPLKLRNIPAGCRSLRLVKGDAEHTEIVEVHPNTETKVIGQFENR